MKLETLEKHVQRLANLQVTKSLVVSCYLNFEDDDLDWRIVVPRREAEILDSLSSTTAKSDVREAFSAIKRWLNSNLSSSSRGAALFARGGGGDLLIPMQFEVPLPYEITVDTVPHLYELVRMKDSFHQYIVLHSDSRSARVFEVNLGRISEQLLIERPEVRSRLGREWTKLHYKRQHRERDRQFLQQKIEVLDKLFAVDPQAHLVLAGDSTYINRIVKVLPQRIAARLVGQVALAKPNSVEKIVLETLQEYVRAEEVNSLNTVDRLFNAIQRGDLAILGAAESLRAAFRGQADTLVLCHEYDLGTAHICQSCNWVAVGETRPDLCAECGADLLLDRDARQELVRVAQTTGCDVETVADSERLLKAGGVGCFLRYADEYSKTPASRSVS